MLKACLLCCRHLGRITSSSGICRTDFVIFIVIAVIKRPGSVGKFGLVPEGRGKRVEFNRDNPRRLEGRRWDERRKRN